MESKSTYQRYFIHTQISKEFKVKNFIWILAVGATLISCDARHKSERLAKIEKLGVELNQVAEFLNEVDSASMAQKIQSSDAKVNWIYENITDTLDRKNGIALGDYMGLNKTMSSTLNGYSQVKREYKYSESQLKSLRKDVENGFFTEEEFEANFETEEEAAERLNEAIEQLEHNLAQINNGYDKLDPIVSSYVDSVKSIILSPKPIAKRKK